MPVRVPRGRDPEEEVSTQKVSWEGILEQAACEPEGGRGGGAGRGTPVHAQQRPHQHKCLHVSQMLQLLVRLVFGPQGSVSPVITPRCM